MKFLIVIFALLLPIMAIEQPVNLDEVLAQLTIIPKLATLPSSYVPEVDPEHYAKKAALMQSYASALNRLAEEYRKTRGNRYVYTRGLYQGERPVNIQDVLDQLAVIPKLETLPSSSITEIDAEHYAKKAELMRSYTEALGRLAEEYRRRQ